MITSGPKAIITNRTVNTGGGSGPGSITSGNIDFYVATTGSDTNPGTVALPFLTIQKAVNSVPKTINKQVTINVGAGNFASFVVAGFNVVPTAAYSTDYAWFHVKGTLQDCVPASTGSASGTVSAFTNTDFLGTFAIITDGANNMTVNEYAGCYIQFLTGTGSTSTVAFPQMMMVVANDATTFTVLNVGLTNPAVNTTYKLVKPASFVTSSAGGTPAVASGNPANVANPTAPKGAFFTNNLGLGYAISNLEFTLSASLTAAIALQESRLRAFNCRIIGTTAASGPIGYNNTQNPTATLDAFGLFINTTGFSSTNILISTVGGGCSLAGPILRNCWIKGGLNGITMANIGPPQLNCCYFSGQTGTAINVIGSLTASQITNCAIDSCPTGISLSEGVGTGLGLCTLGTNGIKITNATVSAITLAGPYASAGLSGISGTTGNLVGLKISRGAKALVASSTTLSGTSEVLIDSVVDTLANMRAASPKVIVNASYGTMFYQ